MGSSPKRRIARDGVEYTRQEFENWYGSGSGLLEWKTAIWQCRRPVDADRPVGRDGDIVEDEDVVIVVPLDDTQPLHLLQVDEFFHGVIDDGRRRSKMAQCFDPDRHGVEFDYFDFELVSCRRRKTWLPRRIAEIQALYRQGLWRPAVKMRRAVQLYFVLCRRYSFSTCYEIVQFFFARAALAERLVRAPGVMAPLAATATFPGLAFHAWDESLSAQAAFGCALSCNSYIWVCI